MIARKRPRWLAPSLMLAACAGLAWFNVQQLQAPPPGPVAVAGGGPAPLPELPAEVSFAMAPAETFSAVVERPLFSPTRRPPPEGTVTINGPPEPELGITLVGVIISAEERIAIVKAEGASQFARLSVGDNFQGWTLESIEPDRVSFRRGEIEEHFELIYEEPPVRKPRRRQRKTRDKRTQGQTQSQTPIQSPSQAGTKTQR